MQLAEDSRLAQAICHVAVDLRQRLGGNFVFVFGVGAHGSDVQAGVQMARFDQRFAARGAGDRDVRAGHGLVDARARRDHQTAVTRQFGAEGFSLGAVTCPDSNGFNRPDQAQRLKLQRRLFAGTDQRHAATVNPRQRTSSDRARRCCAYGGQITVIQQQGIEQTGACRQQHHHAVEAR